MIVDTFLLPRFLVLELVLASHLFQFARPCLTSHSDLSVKKRSLEASSCSIPLTDSSWSFPPLVLDANRDWLLPDTKSSVSVGEGASVLLSCPLSQSGRSAKRSPATAAQHEPVQLLCSRGGILIDSRTQTAAELGQLGCPVNPADTERLAADGGRCGPQQEGQLVDIGFQVGEGHFRPLITVCHVAETEQTLFARHTIRGNFTRDRIRGEAGRPAFREGALFYKQVRAAQAYAKQSQQQMFSRLFGAQLAAEYFTNNHFLAKGHLAPDADFFLKDWQEASYYYSNTAPQWQSVNNGNWKDVEYTVRKLARETGRDLQIWTGTLGVLQLPVNGSQVEVYLTESQAKKYIPVPAYFWKLVIDPVRGEGVALVTVNNPHLSRLPRSTAFCPDQCQQLGWHKHLNTRDKAESGLTFCCSPADFSRTVTWAGPAGFSSLPPLKF